MKPRTLSTAIVVGSTLMAANMLIAILPTDSAIGRSTAAPLQPLRTATGSVQRWNMFTTIPRLRALDAQIVGTTASGDEQRFGAYLPDLQDIEPVERVRYFYTLFRLFESDATDPQLQGYVGRVRDTLRTEAPEITGFSIEMTLDFVRLLERIEADGELIKREVIRYGPYPIDGRSNDS